MKRFIFFLAILVFLLSACVNLSVPISENTTATPVKTTATAYVQQKTLPTPTPTPSTLVDLSPTYFLNTEDFKPIETKDLSQVKGRVKPFTIEYVYGPFIKVKFNRPSMDFRVVEYDLHGVQKVLVGRQGPDYNSKTEYIGDTYFLDPSGEAWAVPYAVTVQEMSTTNLVKTRGKLIYNSKMFTGAELVGIASYDYSIKADPNVKVQIVSLTDFPKKVAGKNVGFLMRAGRVAAMYLYQGAKPPGYFIYDDKVLHTTIYGWIQETPDPKLQGTCFLADYNLKENWRKIDPLNDPYLTRVDCNKISSEWVRIDNRY